MTVEQFRAQQVVWGVLGLCAGLVSAPWGSLRARDCQSLPMLAMVVVGGLGGVLGRDRC